MKIKSSDWFLERCEILRRYQWGVEVMAIGWAYERRWIEWFLIPIASIFIRDYYLQYTNFLSLSNRESVIVSPVITVHTLGEELRDQNSVSPHKMSQLPGPLTQPELAKQLKWRKHFWFRLFFIFFYIYFNESMDIYNRDKNLESS